MVLACRHSVKNVACPKHALNFRSTSAKCYAVPRRSQLCGTICKQDFMKCKLLHYTTGTKLGLFWGLLSFLCRSRKHDFRIPVTCSALLNPLLSLCPTTKRRSSWVSQTSNYRQKLSRNKKYILRENKYHYLIP